MEQEKELTREQSLELITTMISSAKNDFFDTGLSALLWGSVIIFCSLVTFLNAWLHWNALGYVWFLTIVAVIPQIVISIRESRERRFKTHQNDFVGGIWIAFAVAIFLFSFLASVHPIDQEGAIYLTLYGIPTFATGFGRRFRPMIIGGLACWVLAIVSLYVHYPYIMFLLAAGGAVAWFIPGLILRRGYLHAKRKNV